MGDHLSTNLLLSLRLLLALVLVACNSKSEIAVPTSSIASNCNKKPTNNSSTASEDEDEEDSNSSNENDEDDEANNDEDEEEEDSFDLVQQKPSKSDISDAMDENCLNCHSDDTKGIDPILEDYEDEKKLRTKIRYAIFDAESMPPGSDMDDDTLDVFKGWLLDDNKNDDKVDSDDEENEDSDSSNSNNSSSSRRDDCYQN